MKISTSFILAIGLFIWGMCSCSSINTETSDPPVTTEPTAGTDTMASKVATTSEAFDSTNFGIMAASFDLLEIMTSEEALAKAQNPQVKDFAQEMLAEHKKTANEIKNLSNRKDQRLPTELLPDHQELYAEFKKEESKGFDKAYMEMQAKAHLKAVDLFEEAAEDHPDPELRNYAANHLPLLRTQWGKAKKTKDVVD
jgi:putative membrane protein